MRTACPNSRVPGVTAPKAPVPKAPVPKAPVPEAPIPVAAAGRRVVIVLYPGVQPLDAVGPFEVFAGASRAAVGPEQGGGGPGDTPRDARPSGPEGYRVALVSADGAAVRTGSGMELCTGTLPGPDEPIDTLVIPGGEGVAAARRDPVLTRWIATAAPGCRRIATVCTGAFLGAEAGLLDGRRVTTHWASAARLADEFPSVTVDPDPIYLRDGRLWTSAGVTAGIDLALALVEDDLGTEAARTIARWLVMFLHRPGGQSQFAAPVWVPRAERSAVRAVQHRVEDSPGEDHRLPVMAAEAAMSLRHFARVFRSEVGETPGRFVERIRTDAARRELEVTGDTLGVIAGRCGFGTAETLRRVFQRRLGVSPDAYRRRFRADGRRKIA